MTRLACIILAAVFVALQPPPRREEPDPKAPPIGSPIDIESDPPKAKPAEVSPPPDRPKTDTTVKTAEPPAPPPPPNVLVVAVRQLPARLVPTLARTDADRRANQLIYEPLIRPVPDGEFGTRFDPALAVPVAGPGGRTFAIDPAAVWVAPDGSTSPVLAVDVVAAIERLKSDWFADVFTDEPRRVRLSLTRPHPDPLALMTFPLTPHAAAPELLAKRPVGSGPFVWRGRINDKGRTYANLEANPHYGQRSGQANRPPLRGVRFLAASDPVNDFRRGGADLALDVTTPDLAGLMATAPKTEVPLPAAARLESGLGADARVLTRPTRRIHYLAINPTKVAFAGGPGRALRRAVTFAVRRDEILDAVYRGGFAEFHRPLSGPFPPGTWPCPSDAVKLDDPALARAELKAAGVGPLTLVLKYPAEEPLAIAAAELIAKHVADLNAGLTVRPVPVSDDEYQRQVILEGDFDLAWRTFDFADDWFDPVGLFASGRSAELAAKARATLAFAERREWLAKLHRECRDEVPLVPLWNLDAHVVLRRTLRTDPGPERLDPATLFGRADRWRFEP